MTNDMPRPRPPHLHRQVTRHGKTVWYVRIGKGPRTRIHAAFGSPEFDVEYQAALTGTSRPKRGEPKTDSLAWLITRYRESTAWTDLSPTTRRNRDYVLHHVVETAGSQPYAAVTRQTIAAGCARRPGANSARHFFVTMRGLFGWAFKAGHVDVDPTVGVDAPSQNAGGYRPWTEDDVVRYENRWPLGTRQRVWLDVLLYTGLRRGDAVRLGRQHVRAGAATLRTEKTDTEVTLPILPVLQRTLDAGPTGDLAFICSAKGQPLTKGSFGNAFRKACNAAGCLDVSAHGLRKAAATRAADSGATQAQLNAIFGWTGSQMANLYTRSADRKRLAVEAMHKLAGKNEIAPSIPSPSHKVRALGRKS